MDTSKNWAHEVTKSNGVRVYKGSPKGPQGKSGPTLDSTFRKPFPNMGETKTGRHGK